MSWSGPVTGTATYQTPQYASAQPQTYQHGQQQGYNQFSGGPAYPHSNMPPRLPDNRPPKKKGNPIITRYPPPPGYRGPAQPQGPYGASQYPNQFQQIQQPYPQGPQAPPTYSHQGFQASPATPAYSPQSWGPPQAHPQQTAYPTPTHPQAPNYQWPQQQGHTHQPSFQQAQNYPGPQSYAPQQSAYPNYPTPSTPSNPNPQLWPQSQSWHQPNPVAPYVSNAQHNPSLYGATAPDPHATPTPISVHSTASQSLPSVNQSQNIAPAGNEAEPEKKSQLFLAWDDWDFDFDGAIWPKANEPVDPNLSLGVIIWRPAKQVTRALPSTFADAEDQALKPPAEKLGNGESVSMYFTPENSHEAFLDVRQTDEWYRIRKDPVFVKFPKDELARRLIPIEECIDLRDRPDEPLEEIQENEDEDMNDLSWNVMDNLEQALSCKAEDAKPSSSRQAISLRNQDQEDILAKLGVTGSPKPPSNEPISFLLSSNETRSSSLPEKPPVPLPASIPPRPEAPPQRAHSYGGHHSFIGGDTPQRPYGSMSSALHSRPPPVERQHNSSGPGDTQSQLKGDAVDGERGSPTHSEGSNRAIVHTDIESDSASHGVDERPTAVPQLTRSDSSSLRKRNYEDTDQEDENLRQQDDHTKRKRRSQVAAAYSRR